MHEIKSKLTQIANLKLKLSRKSYDDHRDRTDLILNIRKLKKEIISSLIELNISYPLLYKKSSSPLFLQNLKLDIASTFKDKRKYKLRRYLINRSHRDYNEIRSVSLMLETGHINQ